MADKRNSRWFKVASAAAVAVGILLNGHLAAAKEEKDGEPAAEKDTNAATLTIKATHNNEPVAGARVIVTGANDLDRSTKTAADGTVTLRDLPQGEVTVQVIASGFEIYGKLVTLPQSKKPYELNVAMQTESVAKKDKATPDADKTGP
jgi:hypothetical protein